MLKVKFKTDRHLLFDQEKGSRTTDQFYRNDIFRIGGGERVTRTLKFQGGRRGYYTIDEVSLVASDLFLLSQLVADVEVKTELYVYPRPFDSARLRKSLVQINGEILSRRHLLEDPFEYRGIREYQPYDDMRSINWKATARTGDLKVNQKNYTALKSVRVFFQIQDDNILKKDSAVEMSLRIVAALCLFFLRQGTAWTLSPVIPCPSGQKRGQGRWILSTGRWPGWMWSGLRRISGSISRKFCSGTEREALPFLWPRTSMMILRSF